MRNEMDTELYLLLGVMAVFLLLVITAVSVSFFRGFARELKDINIEIQRNSGGERRYWIRQRRRLWLSLLPFVKYRE